MICESGHSIHKQH